MDKRERQSMSLAEVVVVLIIVTLIVLYTFDKL